MKDFPNPELLAALCHDLRGPLGALGTWIHVLGSGRADEQTRTRALTAMTGDVQAMSALIEQVSSLAAVLAGTEAVTVVPIDLVPFLRGVISEAASASRAGVDFGTSENALEILADAAGLRQTVRLFILKEGDPQGARAVRVTREASTAEIAIETNLAARPLIGALARALVEAQGGETVQTSAEGKIVFRIRLPLAR